MCTPHPCPFVSSALRCLILTCAHSLPPFMQKVAIIIVVYAIVMLGLYATHSLTAFVHELTFYMDLAMVFLTFGAGTGLVLDEDDWAFFFAFEALEGNLLIASVVFQVGSSGFLNICLEQLLGNARDRPCTLTSLRDLLRSTRSSTAHTSHKQLFTCTALWQPNIGNPLGAGNTSYGSYQATSGRLNEHCSILFTCLPYAVPHLCHVCCQPCNHAAEVEGQQCRSTCRCCCHQGHANPAGGPACGQHCCSGHGGLSRERIP